LSLQKYEDTYAAYAAYAALVLGTLDRVQQSKNIDE
jgi:hypothetical protein